MKKPSFSRNITRLTRKLSALLCLGLILVQAGFAPLSLPVTQAQSAECAIISGNAYQFNNTTIQMGFQKYSAGYVYSNCSYGSLRLVMLSGPSNLNPSLPYTVPVNTGAMQFTGATQGTYTFQLQLHNSSGSLVDTDSFGVTMTNSTTSATKTNFSSINQGNQTTCTNHRPIRVYDAATNQLIGTISNNSGSVTSTSPAVRFEQSGTITTSLTSTTPGEKGIMAGWSGGFNNSGYVTNNSSTISVTGSLPQGTTTRVDVAPYVYYSTTYGSRVCGTASIDVTVQAANPTISNFTLSRVGANSYTQPGWTNNTTINYNFSSTNATSCRIDSGNGTFTNTACNNGSVTLTGTGITRTLRAQACNGSTCVTSGTQSIQLDTTPPQSGVPFPTEIVVSSASHSYSAIGCSDEESGCHPYKEYLIEPLTDAECSSRANATGWVETNPLPTLTETSSICIRVYDNAGNAGYTGRNSVYFDREEPTISMPRLEQDQEDLTIVENTYFAPSTEDILVSFVISDDLDGVYPGDLLTACTLEIAGNAPLTCEPVGADPLERQVLIPSSQLSTGEQTFEISIQDQGRRITTRSGTISIDSTPPEVTIPGLTLNDPNYRTSAVADLTVSCSDIDGSGCAPQSIQYAIAATLPDNCSEVAETEWVNYNGALPSIQNIRQICVRAQDVAGNYGYSDRYQISVDTQDPEITNLTVSSNGALIEAQNGVYYSSTQPITLGFTPTDTGTGVASCRLQRTNNGNTTTEEIADCTSDTAISAALQNLPQGESTVTLTATDFAGREGSATVHVFFDDTPPEITGTFSAAANELNRTITLTLPTSFDDEDGSGVASLHITITQDGAPFTGLTQEMIDSADAHISVIPGTGQIIITRNTDPDAVAFPSTLTITELPASTDGTDHTYDFTLIAHDLAGNTTTATDTANISGLAFDTIAPEITDLRSTLRGNGSQATPYFIGADRILPLVLTVLENNNSTPRRASTPVTLRIVSVNSPTFQYPDGNIVCNSLLADNTCTGARNLRVPENFDGSIDIVVEDLGGNQSEVRTIYLRQDSDAPTWGPNGAIEATSPDGSALLAENTPFLSQTFHFRARDLINDDAEPQTYANVSYMNAQGEERTQTVIMTRVAGTNDYTFTLTLAELPFGQSPIQFVMEDVYGNQQTPSEAKTYTTFYDNRAPIVENFRYSFVDEDAQIAFDGLTEDSYPVRVSVFQSTDGTNWVERNDVTIADLPGDTNFSGTIPGVPAGSQVRLEFLDSVQQYAENGAGFTTGGTTATQYLMRDILLGITINRAEERLEVQYIPQSDTTTLQNYAVSFSGPAGRTGVFPEITTFNAGGSVGTIDAPLMGEYTFNATLTKTDGSTQTTTRTFILSEDILTPRASFTLPESATVRLEGETYYINSDSPLVNFGYSFAEQQSGIYEESLPVTISATGIDFDTPVTLNTLISANATGTYPVELIEDGIYTLTLSATDNAATRNGVSQTFRIVKDRSEPSVRITPRVGGSLLSLTGNAPEDTVLQTRSDTVSLEVAVDDELEPVTVEVRLNGTLLTERQALPAQPIEPYTQGYTYALTNLEDNNLHTIDVLVRDLSGLTTTETLVIRRDNLPPEVTGAVEFAGDSSNVNPVPFAPGLSVTDYTPVYYQLMENGAALGAPTLFTGNAVTLTEGLHQNLEIIFSDALGNTTNAYNPIPNGGTELYLDTEIPTFSMTITPSEDRTTQPEALLYISDVQDAGTAVTVEIVHNGVPTISTSMASTQFVTGSGFTLPLQQNHNNTFEVRIRDGANNLSAPQTASLIHDLEGPDIDAILGTLSPDNNTITWTFTVTDRLDSGINSVQVLYRDVQTGRVTSSSLSAASAPDFTLDTAVLYSGHDYEITINAVDGLGNIGTATSAQVTIPTDPLDELDPNLDGPTIDPSLTGDTITVTISNGGSINYVAEDLPRGTQVLLGEVLANGTNTVTGQQMSKLPVGSYIMTIVDNEGHTQTIDPFIVHPYYTDAGGDLNGDGYGGGITDHKLLLLAVALGTIYTTPETTDRLATIRGVIENSISTEIRQFLQH